MSFCEHGNEHTGPIKVEEFNEQDYKNQLLKNDPLSYIKRR
jgi:hypothetical protein